jgi:hypothetical protein
METEDIKVLKQVAGGNSYKNPPRIANYILEDNKSFLVARLQQLEVDDG